MGMVESTPVAAVPCSLSLASEVHNVISSCRPKRGHHEAGLHAPGHDGHTDHKRTARASDGAERTCEPTRHQPQSDLQTARSRRASAASPHREFVALGRGGNRSVAGRRRAGAGTPSIQNEARRMSPKSAIGAWMKFYPQDWLGSTRMMPPTARAAFVDLLCYAWEHGGIPGDVNALARFCGMSNDEFAEVWECLSPRWVPSPRGSGLLVNPKQERVRSEQDGRVEQRREAGRAGWVDVPEDERARIMAERGRQSGKARRERTRKGRANGVLIEQPTDNERMESVPPSAGSFVHGTDGEREDSGLRTQDSDSRAQGPERGATAPAPRRRRDGSAELAHAVEAWEEIHGPARSDLLEALESYRVRRVKAGHSLLDREQWQETLQVGEGDQECLIDAFKLASRSAWKSVHPRPGACRKRLTTQDRTAQNLAEVREGIRRLEGGQ